MTEHAAFLQAIIESPDDNTPRLIYADWLEDHGHGARAEFIRLQIESDLKEPTAGDRFRFDVRESELRQIHRDEWLGELPQLEGVKWDTFRRGFIEAIRVTTVEVFATHAPAIFAAAPVQEVGFGSLLPNAVRELAELPFLSQVRALLVEQQQLRNVGVLTLAGSQFLSGLVEMFLPGNHIGDAGAAALAESPYLTRLTQLDLRDNQLTDLGVGTLARSPNLGRLQVLYLVNNQIGDDGLIALAESGHLGTLKRLYLNHNRIGDVAVVALALSHSLSGLTALDLRNNEISASGGMALAHSPFLQDVEELLLTGNTINTVAVAALQSRFGRKVRV